MKGHRALSNLLIFITFILVLEGCNSAPELGSARLRQPFTTNPDNYQYLIGPGDNLQVFVWRNPEVSATVTVRPDGKITTPLVEDINASNITPAQLARNIERVLGTYIKDPIVTVTMRGFSGPLSEQIRVVGEASKPNALPYRQHMTLLDAMISVGGLTDFADGNDARIFRVVNGSAREYRVRLDDLIRGGDITANVELLPGDILIIPEAWF